MEFYLVFMVMLLSYPTTKVIQIIFQYIFPHIRRALDDYLDGRYRVAMMSREQPLSDRLSFQITEWLRKDLIDLNKQSIKSMVDALNERSQEVRDQLDRQFLSVRALMTQICKESDAITRQAVTEKTKQEFANLLREKFDPVTADITDAVSDVVRQELMETSRRMRDLTDMLNRQREQLEKSVFLADEKI